MNFSVVFSSLHLLILVFEFVCVVSGLSWSIDLAAVQVGMSELLSGLAYVGHALVVFFLGLALCLVSTM